MPSVIKCIVKGNKIEEVLLALSPFVLEPPVVEVITNRADSPVKKAHSNGAITKAVYDAVASAAKKGLKTVTTKDLKAAAHSIGGSNSGYNYALKLMLQQKKLKKTSTPATYEIIK